MEAAGQMPTVLKCFVMIVTYVSLVGVWVKVSFKKKKAVLKIYISRKTFLEIALISPSW